MPVKRNTRTLQIQIKVTEEEKQLFEFTAEDYNITLAAFARLAMEYVAHHKPPLHIRPGSIQSHPDPHKPDTHNHIKPLALMTN